LRSLAPTQELVKVILQHKDRMPPPVLAEARKIVRTVVDRLAEKLRRDTGPALSGTSGRDRGRPLRTFRNVDWRGTVRRNLRRWDPVEERLVPESIRFFHRQRARPRWRIIVAVDQSGSMLDSVIHASVLTAILASLPSVSVHLVLWDHRVVDLSHLAHDPLEVLFAAQLGGGTNLLPALRYCADLVTEPERTVLAVVSDFHLYDEPAASLALAEELATAGVHGFGLCALDADGRSVYDERFARALAATGWWVGAVTPVKLAERLGPLLR
jgi:Mg-chelatase subunit ChlD